MRILITETMITFIVPVKYSSVLNHVSRYNIKIFSFKRKNIFERKMCLRLFRFSRLMKKCCKVAREKKSFDAVNCLSSKKTTVKD